MAKLDVNVNQLNSDIQGIKTAIVEANVEVPDGTPICEYSGLIGSVYEKGQDDGITTFLNEFQQNGNRDNYQCAFGAQWTKEMLAQLPHPVRPKNAYMMFWTNTGEYVIINDFVEWCEETNFVLDFSNCVNAYYGLARLHSEHFGTLDFRKCTDLGLLFYSHNNVRGVVKIDNFISSEITGFRTNTFQNAIRLTDIKMSGVVACSINLQACPLNVESMKSVISALENYSGTDNEFKYTVSFSSNCLTALETEGNTSPNDNSWLEYIEDLGWLLG